MHAEWLQAAVLARAIPEIGIALYVADPPRFQAVKWKPRGWQSVDPQKEVKALADAVNSGFMTLTDVLAQWNGGTTLEEYIETRKGELDALREAGLLPAAAPAEPTDEPIDEPVDDQVDDATDDQVPARARLVVTPPTNPAKRKRA